MRNELGKVLKELRTKYKLTQQEIADKINITQRAYSFYENDKRQPDIDTLIELAEFYSIPIDVLVGRYSLRH